VYPHLSISLKVVVKYINTDGQVTSVKRIRPVPSLRTKLTALSNTRVEITQREQNALEFILTSTHLQRILTREQIKGKFDLSLCYCKWHCVCNLEIVPENRIMLKSAFFTP